MVSHGLLSLNVVFCSQLIAIGRHFCCFHAIDSQKGIYYDFAWEAHHLAALKTANYWETAHQWDVTPLSVPDTPQKRVDIRNKSTRGGRTVLQGVPEEEESDDQSEPDEPQTSCKRKRKRAAQDASTPSKRARLSQNDPGGQVDVETTSTGKVDEDVTAAPIPRTPSRRGRRKATSTPSARKTLSRNDEGESDDEKRGFPESAEPRTPSRRGRRQVNVTRKAMTRSPEVSSDDEVRDSDYKAIAASPESTDMEEAGTLQEVEAVPKTPSRRNRDRSATSTPRKKRGPR